MKNISLLTTTVRSVLATVLMLGVTGSSMELTAFARCADTDADSPPEVKAAETETKTVLSQRPVVRVAAPVSIRVWSPRNAAPPTAVAQNVQQPSPPTEAPKKKSGRLKRILIVAAAAGAGVAIVAATKRDTSTPEPTTTVTFGQPVVGQPQ
jgi:hypothetical protein